MLHNAELSECSCFHQAGEWGAGGWHYYRMTTERFVQRAMQRYFDGLKSAASHSDAAATAAREDAERMARHYVGEPIAFEQCPKYRAALEREAQGEKSDSSSSSGQREWPQ